MSEAATTPIGFVGLGKMGTPMCKHISAAGGEVTAYVRSEAGRAKAAAIEVNTADTLSAIAVRSSVVITSLTDDSSMLEVAQGLAPHLKRGNIFIETSTVSPKASEQVARLMTEAGVDYLRCPVSGSTLAAESKQLTVLASGPQSSFERALPILQCFSAKQFHVGDAEQARYLKLVLNSMVGATSALLAEALAIGRCGGMDIATMLEVLNNSAVASPVIRYKTQLMIDGNYPAAFPVTGMLKDFDIALSVGQECRTSLPLLAQIRHTYASAAANGADEKDFFVLVKLLSDNQPK